MEDVLARRDLSHLCPVNERLHADDTLCSVELIDSFVVLFKFEKRDQLLVAVDKVFVYNAAHALPLSLALLPVLESITIALGGHPLVAGTCLRIRFIALLFSIGVNAKLSSHLAAQTQYDSAAGQADAAEQDEHQQHRYRGEGAATLRHILQFKGDLER